MEKLSKVVWLRRQLDHFNVEFLKKLDEEATALEHEAEEHLGPGSFELVDGLGSFPLLTESQQQMLLGFNFDEEQP